MISLDSSNLAQKQTLSTVAHSQWRLTQLLCPSVRKSVLIMQAWPGRSKISRRALQKVPNYIVVYLIGHSSLSGNLLPIPPFKMWSGVRNVSSPIKWWLWSMLYIKLKYNHTQTSYFWGSISNATRQSKQAGNVNHRRLHRSKDKLMAML